MARVRISGNNLARGNRIPADRANQFRRKQSFAVIFEDNGVGLGEKGARTLGQAGDLGRGGGANLLAVHPNDLLVARDDACFYDRSKVGVFDYVCGIDLLFRQKLTELPSAAVRSNYAENRHMGDKFT